MAPAPDRSFDVLPDDRGFVMTQTVAAPEDEIVLLRNFGAELKGLVAK